MIDFSMRFMNRTAALNVLKQIIPGAEDFPPDGWYQPAEGPPIYFNMAVAFGNGTIMLPDGADAGGNPKHKPDPFWVLVRWMGPAETIPQGFLSAKAEQNAIRFG